MLSLNDRALELADRLAADAEAARVEVTTLSNGTRVIDCGAQAAGGFEAGRRFAEICMAGLGSGAYAPLVIEGRLLPALPVPPHRPPRAGPGGPDAGRRVGPGRYLAQGGGPRGAPVPPRGP